MQCCCFGPKKTLRTLQFSHNIKIHHKALHKKGHKTNFADYVMLKIYD